MVKMDYLLKARLIISLIVTFYKLGFAHCDFQILNS